MKPGLVILLWIARNLLALGVIVGLLLAAKHLAPPVSEWARAQSAAIRTLPAQERSYFEAERAFENYARDRAKAVDDRIAALAAASQSGLQSRLRHIEREIARNEADQAGAVELALAAARGDSSAVFQHYRSRAEVALLQSERRQIESLLLARDEALSLAARRRSAIERQQASRQAWVEARDEAKRLEARPFAGARNAACRLNPLDVGCPNYRRLAAARERMGEAAAENRNARRELVVIDSLRRGTEAPDRIIGQADSVLDEQRAALAHDRMQIQQTAEGNWGVAAWKAIAEVLPMALLILALALASPLLIKAFLYFIVAPLAERRSPVRLMPEEEGRVGAVAVSAVSQRIALKPGDELLIRPEAIQSTPHSAAKRTRWLLDWRIPFSSLASGLIGMTEIRADRPDTVLVSAANGPLAEIAVVSLDAGSALVLRPRALQGLIQAADDPIRITRRWRFGLSAWLTLQFRYLIFHGPCVFIVEGARGVRLESARTGRGINQAATIGFSAGLAYSVSRSETFGAYLFDKQALFNDSFEGAVGAHLHEEALLLRSKGGIWSGGLRGVGDAALKLIGL